MKKTYIHNLHILITDSCNLDCIDCKCGKSGNYVISDEIIQNIFDNIDIINTLIIDGGEPLLYPNKIKKIFEEIIRRKIIVNDFCINTNGTMYSEEVEKMCKLFEYYIKRTNDVFKDRVKYPGYITYNSNLFHRESLARLSKKNPEKVAQYLENIKKLKEKSSSRILNIREIPVNIINEGNATRLTEEKMNIVKRILKDANFAKSRYAGIYTKKVELDPMKIYVYETRDMIFIGPYISIGNNGIITEPNASIENQKNEYNYGNIKEDLSKVIRNKGIKCNDEYVFKEKVKLEEEKYYKKTLMFEYYE